LSGLSILAGIRYEESCGVNSNAEWVISEVDASRVRSIQQALGLHEAVARVLVNRGVDTEDAAKRFLDPDLSDLHDPYLFRDMRAAVARIARAIRGQESIVVYGDYDVDGITGTAILVKFLRRLGGSVQAYIPDRQEGYGLNCDAIRSLADQGCKLVVTVDCGISAREEIALGYSLGMDFIVTDHHEPPLELPSAEAILNPKIQGSGYPFPGLAGVGVAFKLIEALVRGASRKTDISGYLNDYLDLVALGTIADMVPLVDENRVIVRTGLPRIGTEQNAGLVALSRVAGVDGKNLSVRDAVFALAPRINAAGRMGSPILALDLLLSANRHDAIARAQEIDTLNDQRRSVQQEILDDILLNLPSPDDCEDGIVVAVGDAWHPGVVGLVASKITEMYYRPAVVLSLEGEYARGSARSIPGFDIFSALRQCSDLLCEFGGHQQAAGLTVRGCNIAELTKRLKSIASESICPELLSPQMCIDCVLDLSDLHIDLAREIERLEPFGESNPAPLFLVRDLPVLEYRTVGEGARHLKLILGTADHRVEAIAFGSGHLAEFIRSERVDSVDVVGELSVNEWNGTSRLQMVVYDLASRGTSIT
jgi:single-stranded-DNA-specific exonuclease